MNDDDLTIDLSRELQGRSDAMHGTSLALADVKQRAASIRRRRTVTAVGGAVAAVVLIVPTAALASHHAGHSTEPLPATRSITPTPSPTTAEGEQPAAGVLDVSDLPTGAAPAMEYVTGGSVLHRIDGGTAAVGTRYPVRSFVALTDGSRVWQTDHDGQPYVEIRDPGGTLHDPVRSEGGLAVNPQHSIAGWVGPSGQVMVWELGATSARALGTPITAGSERHIAAMTGEDCSLACTAYVNVGGVQTPSGRQPWGVSDSVTQPSLEGDFATVADIDRSGLTVGATDFTDVGSCSELVGGGDFRGFSTYRNTLQSLSPDGRLILGLPAHSDGLGPNELAMYDLSGRRLFERRATENAQATYQSYAWEDDAHVLISAFQGGRWSLVRVASDGSLESAVAPIGGHDVENPYVLPTGGMPVGD